jgi:hypothetical protein
MLLVHRDRDELPLPKVPGYSQAGVDVAGVMAVDIAESTPQPVLVRGHRDDMNMVGRQAERPDRNPGALRPIGQQIEIERKALILEKPSARVD